jgi:hypothetical protein
MDDPRHLRPRAWVAGLGALALVGPLLAAHTLPRFGDPLRAGALIVFLALGVYETVWRRRPR